MQIIGQETNLDIINRWSTLPNFIIIQGEEHSGKNHLVLYLCDKYKLRYVKVDKSVKSVRNFIANLSPYSNNLYHLDNFDDASLQAKNALLKCTEEPIIGNYIVITGGHQLKTLESRAKKLVMEPYTLEQVSEYMRPFYPDKDEQQKLYIAGINTPAKVNYYKQYEHIQGLLNYAYEVFESITYISPNTIIPMLSRFEARYDNGKTDSCLLFLNMLINIIKYKIENNGYYSYKNILDILLEGKYMLQNEYTLNRKFLLFRIFSDIYKLGESNLN